MHDVSNERLPFMGCRDDRRRPGRAPRSAGCRSPASSATRSTCPAAEHATLYETLLEAGRAIRLPQIGFNAINSLRLEKSFGIWSREFTQGYTPGMTGLDRFIDFDKGDFIGREAALRERDGDTARQMLVTLEVDAVDADASGYEPIWKGGRRVGYVTSGGYGHTDRQEPRHGLCRPRPCRRGTELAVHIVGDERPCRVIAPSPHDPEGRRLRA